MPSPLTVSVTLSSRQRLCLTPTGHSRCTDQTRPRKSQPGSLCSSLSYSTAPSFFTLYSHSGIKMRVGQSHGFVYHVVKREEALRNLTVTYCQNSKLRRVSGLV